MKLDGNTYKPGAVIFYKEEKGLIIDKIFATQDKIIYFKGKKCTIKKYYKHYRAYELETSLDEVTIPYTSLLFKISIHPRKCRVLPQSTIIIFPYFLF